MVRFFKNEHDAIKTRADALKDFSDLLFAELHASEFSIEALAKHLNVEVADVHEWLGGKSLPSRDLFVRLIIIIRGCDPSMTAKELARDNVWSKITEFIHEVENIQALKDIKLTQPRADK